jgi:hypothetical protein
MVEIRIDRAAFEADEDYEDVGEDFHAMLKKLRKVAKVCIVANKVTFSAMLIHFCMLQLLYSSSKLMDRKHI